MSENHLTEGAVCAVSALRMRGFVVCRAETNEGFFSPCSMSHDLRSNRPSLPVELDYLSAHCRPTPFPHHLRRVAVRLPDFSRRVGDARDQRHHPVSQWRYFTKPGWCRGFSAAC